MEEVISCLGCGALYLSFVNKVSFLVSKFLLSDPSISPTRSLTDVNEVSPGLTWSFLYLSSGLRRQRDHVVPPQLLIPRPSHCQTRVSFSLLASV